jgi:branched-chain amino acid transport system substrate-binding protein
MTYPHIHRRLSIMAGALGACLAAVSAHAQQLYFPIVVPITGILAVEGANQRNGSQLAFKHAPAGVGIRGDVVDTGSSAASAVTALERAIGAAMPIAAVASVFGTEMLAMGPIAQERKVPLITISGTARITEMGNPYIFRYFLSDVVVKKTQARYTVEELGKKRPAVLFENTAYGQSGRGLLVEYFKQMNATVVLDEGVGYEVKDMSPVLARVKASNPDVVVLHMNAGLLSLVIKQARASGFEIPIVASSSMAQPHTAKLFEQKELAGICAETGSSPVAVGTPEMKAFLDAYRSAYGSDPDGLTVAQYDGVMMTLEAVKSGARNAEQVRSWLASNAYKGAATTYKTDGKGNMNRDSVIVCYDGNSHVPKIAKSYTAD